MDIRNGVAAKPIDIVSSDHEFQAGVGLQEVSKAAHIPLLKWAIQHFVLFAAEF